MILTYIIIFVFFIFIAIVVLYLVQTYVLPKKLTEIASMIEAGQTKLAIRKLDEIIEKDERNHYAHYLLAEAYSREGNTQYAIVEYRQVIKIGHFDHNVNEIAVRSKLASLHKERNSLEEAKKEYLILTKIDPSNYDNYFQLGILYFNVGLLDKAAGYMKKSTACNVNHEPSFYYLGQIYYRNNSYTDAKQMFLQSVKLDPSNQKSHYFLGLVLRQQGDFDWAIKEFEIAQKNDELKVKSFMGKGSCYMEKGQHPKAVIEFERGLKFVRRGTETELKLRYLLAECQEKMRDIHSAIYNWEKISEVNSGFRDVTEKLKKYADFRQDDRIKDFMIAGLSQFEHICRKIVERMHYNIMDVEIMSDTDIEITAIESEGKWRNTRQINRIVRIIRTTDTIREQFVRDLHETMRSRNANRIIIITTGDFSHAALDFANTRPIELLGKSELIDMLRKT